ncbi:MAG: 50S ribosomal protein L25 [Saprospiraceae bacterium]|jgi:large subunit ribosomal protein L25|nr:50S ribosomal protein L25 [Saprospiraceae bacterium]MCB0604412.1 50S ribosomal protein L25 [Saprospiraceae bacterium]MCO5278195.1 50S ribosomal protein L25 [Saprospiraceae bacterium]HQU96146.1 50S ribosomal protein L25 [Saprospiraceae bacterium]HQW95734.1 50S ribosomal protein L25 [Saprospiraceae bacterium]
MNTIAINGNKRNEVGKKATKAVRSSNSIPCVLYSSAKENIHFHTTEAEVKNLVFTPEFKVAELNIDGVQVNAILKDIQFHPVKDNIIHIDFLQLVEKHPVIVEIPLKTKGSSPGVKIGGKLMQSIRKVKVKTVPENLVNELFIDISSMELGQSLRIKDIIIPEGIEVMQNGSIPVVSIEVPRALKSAAAAEK